MTQDAAAHQRVEMLQRQVRASGNLHALLAAKDRELAACRARLEQHEALTTTKTRSDPNGDATPRVEEQAKSRLTDRSRRILILLIARSNAMT